MRITDVRPVLLTHPYGSEPDGRRSACFVEVEFVEPLIIHDGHVEPPKAPGLGIRLSADLREKYRFVAGSGSVFGV